MRWINRDRSVDMDCTSLESYIQGEAEGGGIGAGGIENMLDITLPIVYDTYYKILCRS